MMGAALKLSGINLLVFAYIYGFWVSGKCMFASCSKMAELFGCRREAVNLSLTELQGKKYITRLADKSDFGTNKYIINADTLEDLCGNITAGCDFFEQGGMPFSHMGVCENKTGPCAENAHNNKTDKTNDNKGDNCPLPLNCIDDAECRRLWQVILQSPKWAKRSPAALAEAVAVLGNKSVEVCRAMLSHTISGDYPKIYEPNAELLEKAEKAKAPGCAKIAHPNTSDKNKDDEIFRQLYPKFPKELKESIYGSAMSGERGLRFVETEGEVTITCSPEVKNWLESIPDSLNQILKSWVKHPFRGFNFG